jgi:hypothetical protein
MCHPCYYADLAKQQQGQGLKCSGCGREGKLIVSNGLCHTCRRKQKAEADQRAAVEEYMAVASTAAKEDEHALYLRGVKNRTVGNFATVLLHIHAFACLRVRHVCVEEALMP